MIVQWCIKGISLGGDDEAKQLIDSGEGLHCNWWRDVHTITPLQIREKLTSTNADHHVNQFDGIDPGSGRPFREVTPFISFTAGTVERDAVAKTNLFHSARSVALWFGTDFGQRDHAYLYTCWVVLAPRPAVEIEGVAEEVRDLNAYRRFSAFQTEGEILVKIALPDNQIRDCEKWTFDRHRKIFTKEWAHINPRFTSPAQLSNIRDVI
ncbi:hypothetical protein Psi02_78530 [Planotetraspora silvatica]|uniref:Uncharacterized protein n=1 Tax=Planotetraspora silvatica TaxID=234614 RepID=A0A8J3USZ0_9ACTN|nr:hypothetical protein [Planotetraspora silvatica]GII51429.1 hypothetical protein Psi02_78530 [Planotetraspora silvatica]